MRIFLGFDFYGAGNIGDDLVLAGLLTLLPEEHTLSCVIPRDPRPLRARFPRVQWIRGEGPARADVLRTCDLWLGVGAVPFAATHRAWLLRRIAPDLLACRARGVPALMAGVGVEAGLLDSPHADLGRAVLAGLTGVIARDPAGTSVLKRLAPEAVGRIHTGIDLANFHLSGLSTAPGRQAEGPVRVGLCYWEETMGRQDLGILRKAVRQWRRHGDVVSFFANETRPAFEYAVYRKVCRPWERGRVPCLQPNRRASCVETLTDPVRRVDRVVTSRYHALLTAAWYGVPATALGDRPKVVELAARLGLPRVGRGWSLEHLEAAPAQAVDASAGVRRYFAAEGPVLRATLERLLSGLDVPV